MHVLGSGGDGLPCSHDVRAWADPSIHKMRRLFPSHHNTRGAPCRCANWLLRSRWDNVSAAKNLTGTPILFLSSLRVRCRGGVEPGAPVGPHCPRKRPSPVRAMEGAHA